MSERELTIERSVLGLDRVMDRDGSMFAVAGGSGREQREANARLIVAAVNALPGLVGALQQAAIELDEAASELAMTGRNRVMDNCTERAMQIRTLLASVEVV